jgi:outer membrane protein
VGYVDSEIILKQLPEAEQIKQELEALQKLYLDTIQAKENELKEKAETFKTKYEEAQELVASGTITSEEDIKKLEDELAVMQNEIRGLDEGLVIYKQKIQNDLLQKQADLFKPVKDKITKVIEEVAKKMKINFVFDKADGTLIYGDKEFDITFKVLDKLK